MKRLIPIVLIFLPAVFASCSKPNLSFDFGNFGSYGSPTWDPNSIFVYNNKFTPDSFRVKKGTTVTWHNLDSYQHNLISLNNSTLTGTVMASGELKYTFQTVGAIKYQCTTHSESGTITVLP